MFLSRSAGGYKVGGRKMQQSGSEMFGRGLQL